jgi:hypothetical protein
MRAIKQQALFMLSALILTTHGQGIQFGVERGLSGYKKATMFKINRWPQLF